MTRLGKRPIPTPKGVEIKVDKGTVQIKGPKGLLSMQVPEGILVSVSDDGVLVSLDEEVKVAKPMQGLYRALIGNDIVGVTEGYSKKLILIGVGYRAAAQGKALDLQLGFSHPCKLTIPEGIELKIEKSTQITIIGISKQLVGQFAADIRKMKPPEPYKGKGIRYENEHVRKKAGKAAKGK